ncbi:MAG: hypothetical protein IPJ34_31650 [Myxococcales bacterium]|nr:hypothetical protein [Myxococcales bacterium]
MSFDPYAPPAAPIARDVDLRLTVFVEDYKLAIKKGSTLPACCVRCGEPADTRVSHRFSFTPRWVGWLFLLSWCFALPVMFAVTKRASLDMPLCSPHAVAWKRGRTQRWIGLGVLVLGVALGIVSLVVEAPEEVGLTLIGAGLFVGILLAVLASKQFLRADKVDEHYVYVVGVHPGAIAAALHASTQRPL